MTTTNLTRDGLIRALSRRARPMFDQAARRRAEKLVESLTDEERQLLATSIQRSEGHYAVTVAGPRLFDREFGSIDREADPVIGPAIETVRDTGGDEP